MSRVLFLLATSLIATGIAGAAWSSTQLAEGIIEIPRHWWSTVATLPIVAGAALLLLPTVFNKSRAAV